MKNPRAPNNPINIQIINKKKKFYQKFCLIPQNAVNEMQKYVMIKINISIKSVNFNANKSIPVVPYNIKLIV